METERIFVIGDIHGCLDMLKRLMEKIAWRQGKDRLIFVGDYIDRGEDPFGVVEFLVSLGDSPDSQVDFLLGNHEAMFLDYLKGIRKDLYLYNGGVTTVASYRARLPEADKEDTLVPEAHMAFFEGLVPYVELDDYYVVHAGFRPGVPIDGQSMDDMLWIRDEFIYSEYNFGKRVIFGHTWFDEPLVQRNKIGIDTGAVYGNKLTCLELPDLRFYHVYPR